MTRRAAVVVAFAAAVVVLPSCIPNSGSAPEVPTRNFEVSCDSTDTAQQTALFCLRHDTRTGDVKRVKVDNLPQSRGPTASQPGPPGTYELVCHATSTDMRADLFCLRLNTLTGEMLMISLPKVAEIP